MLRTIGNFELGDWHIPVQTGIPDATEFLRLAYNLAHKKSDDPSTEVGAVVVRKGEVLVSGVNHMPARSLCFDKANLERPYKYKLIEHAERDAVYTAARCGVALDGSVMFAPWAACSDCARAIVLSGIDHVVAHYQAIEQTPKRWKEEIEIGLLIFDAAGVSYVLFDGNIGGVENLFDGKIWYP